MLEKQTNVKRLRRASKRHGLQQREGTFTRGQKGKVKASCTHPATTEAILINLIQSYLGRKRLAAARQLR
jgi:hypothetical protein